MPSTRTRPSSLARTICDSLPLDESGRIRTDAELRVSSSDSLFALGDVACKTPALGAAGSPAPPTAQAAMQQADYCAWNVRASLMGTQTLPFRYANLGEMLSLGGKQGSITSLAGLVELDGKLASASRRAVYAARMPTADQAIKVGLSWAVDAAGMMAKAINEARGGKAGAK